MITIVETLTEMVKNPSTKTTYNVVSIKTQEVSEQIHKNRTSKESQRFFRRLGGIETAVYGYTVNGYVCIQLTSTSPDKQIKKVRQYMTYCSEPKDLEQATRFVLNEIKRGGDKEDAINKALKEFRRVSRYHLEKEVSILYVLLDEEAFYTTELDETAERLNKYTYEQVKEVYDRHKVVYMY